MVGQGARLDALTGLRFFASAAIVYLHIAGNYGVSKIDFPLGNGVMLFFVLSGFILTFVYPDLKSCQEAGSYLVSRFARIWPLHLVCFILATAVYVEVWKYPVPRIITTAIFNILLLQGWVPISPFVYSFNAVSWTLSVEVFFYLLFPLLIANFKSSWHWKLVLSFCMVLVMSGLTSSLGLKLSSAADVPNSITMMGTSPPSRLFEFVVGMTCCLGWRRFGGKLPKSFLIASLLEVGAVGFTWWLGYNVRAVSVFGTAIFGESFGTWIMLGGGMIPAAVILIVILASGHGIVGKLLASRPLLFLGEISFATYMVHVIVHVGLVIHFDSLKMLPWWVALAVYLSITFAMSSLLFFAIEKPCRNWIRSRWRVEPEPRQMVPSAL